jgi:hypothetical protein
LLDCDSKLENRFCQHIEQKLFQTHSIEYVEEVFNDYHLKHVVQYVKFNDFHSKHVVQYVGGDDLTIKTF